MGNNSTIMLSHNSLDLFPLPYNIINGKYKRCAVLPPFEIPKTIPSVILLKEFAYAKRVGPNLGGGGGGGGRGNWGVTPYIWLGTDVRPEKPPFSALTGIR